VFRSFYGSGRGFVASDKVKPHITIYGRDNEYKGVNGPIEQEPFGFPARTEKFIEYGYHNLEL
jgi:hypothetical protein